jgi:ribosome recycling factor
MQLVIPLPPITRQTRLENQVRVKELAEKQKVVVRSLRQDKLKGIKAATKKDKSIGKDEVARAEKEVEKEVKEYLEKIGKISEKVQKEIMEI